MSSVVIKNVSGKKEMRAFIRFNYEMYRDCPYAVPDFLEDTQDTFDPKKNAALEFCDAEWFVAYRDGRMVGRIVAILNNRANQRWNTRIVRFGWIDFIDDMEVSSALIQAVEQWGKERDMDTIVGPLGFTDMDKEGMLFEGYDHLGTMPTIYNYPYYNEHMQRMGFQEDAIWVDRTIQVPSLENNQQWIKFQRVAELVRKRYGFRLHKFTTKQELRESGYIQKIFDIINTSYRDLYGYSEMTQRQIDQYAETYLNYLDLRLLSVVENEQGEPIAVGVCMPDMSRAVQKAKAKLFPWGWFHLAKALYWKHSDAVDLLLIGALPKYHDTGCISLIFSELIPRIQSMGFKTAECCPQLETNSRALIVWKSFDSVICKRRHTWKKTIK